MKKTILLIITLTLLSRFPVSAVDSSPEVSAQSAVLIDGETGRVLWEKNADQKMLIASTTKIMTAVIALETSDLKELVLITDRMADIEGSSMYLQVGKVYTVEELLYGLLLASGNDAATALALHIAGDERAFAVLMNKKAEALGMHNTSFENPHGLDGENHYSTASDMAKLAVYAMENENFSKITSTRHTTIKGLTYVNHNKLLWQCEGVIGVKTGYTRAAGRTLVSCCERSGQRIICVTLCAPNDWNDHRKLFDWAYNEFMPRPILTGNENYLIPLISGNSDYAEVIPNECGIAFSREDEEIQFILELPRFVFAPIRKGEHAGKLIGMINGTAVCEIPLVYKQGYNLEVDN